MSTPIQLGEILVEHPPRTVRRWRLFSIGVAIGAVLGVIAFFG